MKPDRHKFYHVKLIQEGRPAYTTSIVRPSDVAVFFQKYIGDCVQERFAAIYLNARNVPLGWQEISRGTVSSSLVHPREVFAPAIKLVASGLIIAHNHPSGDTTPSRDDIELTRRLVKAGELLGIEVMDHLIVSATAHLSLKEAGVI